MKRHIAKHWPKHVRRMSEALRRIGAIAILVEVGRGYVVSWTFAGVPMKVAMCRSAGANAFESAWLAVRRQFRSHHMAVPA